ncbi:MAG: peptidase [Fibrobacteres bacterium]|nr:peptidase [Fibrobacterota bacterium]
MKGKLGWMALAALPFALQNCMNADPLANAPATGEIAKDRPVEIAFPGREGTVRQGTLNGDSIQYLEIDGKAVFQGDILLTPDPSAPPGLSKDASTGRSNLSYRWPNDVVYYNVSETMKDQYRVFDAIKAWEAKTYVRFVRWEYGNPNNHVTFADNGGTGCSSPVGMNPGQVFVNIGSGCNTASAIHEIGHTLGLWHEQCRRDQAKWITVNYGNIKMSARFNFATYAAQNEDGFDDLGMDFTSIMMYPSFIGDPAIAIDPSIAVMRKLDNSTWGASSVISSGDVRGVLRMYPSIWINLGSTPPAMDIGVGANGTGWMISTNATTGGGTIHRLSGTSWVNIPGGAVKLDVDPAGNAWVVTDAGRICSWNGTSWVGRERGRSFKDIGIGGDGTVWAISDEAITGGGKPYRWNGSDWVLMPGGGARISVDGNGMAWMVDVDGKVLRWNGSSWTPMPGLAKDIGCGPEGTVFMVSKYATAQNYTTMIWNGLDWTSVAGMASAVDIGPGGNPWVVGTDQGVYY